MKHLLLAFLFFTCSLSLSAQDYLSGIWDTGDNNTLVTIEKQNNIYTGKILSTDNDYVKPGTVIMKDFAQKDGKWTFKIYAPRQDTWYDAALHPENNMLIITVTFGILSKTIEWAKTKAGS